MAEELERRGHRVLAPALRADRVDESLAFHAGTVVEALEQSGFDPGETIVVAHSAAGMYLPLVVERWCPRRMVFLAAVVPQPGVSLMDQFRADRSMMNPAWVGKNPMDDAVALEFTLHDCPPERLGWAMSTRALFHAKQAMEEPSPLKNWPSVPASYIVCADDRTVTPDWQRRAARELLGVEPLELPGGHCPNISRPEALAEILDQIGQISEARAAARSATPL